MQQPGSLCWLLGVLRSWHEVFLLVAVDKGDVLEIVVLPGSRALRTLL